MSNAIITFQGVSAEDFLNTLTEKVFARMTPVFEQLIVADGKELLTIKETAEYFNVGAATIHNWARQGHLKKHHMNKSVFFKKTEVQTAIKSLKKYQHNKLLVNEC